MRINREPSRRLIGSRQDHLSGHGRGNERGRGWGCGYECRYGHEPPARGSTLRGAVSRTGGPGITGNRRGSGPAARRALRSAGPADPFAAHRRRPVVRADGRDGQPKARHLAAHLQPPCRGSAGAPGCQYQVPGRCGADTPKPIGRLVNRCDCASARSSGRGPGLSRSTRGRPPAGGAGRWTPSGRAERAQGRGGHQTTPSWILAISVSAATAGTS